MHTCYMPSCPFTHPSAISRYIPSSVVAFTCCRVSNLSTIRVFLCLPRSLPRAIGAVYEVVNRDMSLHYKIYSKIYTINIKTSIVFFLPNSESLRFYFSANIMAKKAPHPFGMVSREIPDSCITASSQQDPFHRPNQARLNNEHSGKNAGAWCPKKHNNNQWLQIDFGKIRNIQQIAIQVFFHSFALELLTESFVYAPPPSRHATTMRLSYK